MQYLPALVVALLLSIVVLDFYSHRQKALSSYETADGWVYECSQPITAKSGTPQALAHPQGLVPVDESEAGRYCHEVGIE